MSADPDIVQGLRKHTGQWCFQEYGEDGNLWTQGSFLPTDAADEIEWLRKHIRCLIENDPNDDAADGVSVLDVWRRQALERFGEYPKPVAADEEITF